MAFFDFFTSDIAIDLGTANTLIIYKDKIVVDEPSIIALDKANNKVLAIGREAMQMHEKTHDHIKTIRPLKEGVIADFQARRLPRVLLVLGHFTEGNELMDPVVRADARMPRDDGV